MWFLIFALVCYGLSSSASRYPESTTRTVERITYDNSSASLRSLQIARRMSKLRTLEEYLDTVKGRPVMPVSILDGRIGQRSIATRAKPAICMPELQTVPVMKNPNPTAYYIPSCIRVMRCGGCCNHELFSCEPIATNQTNFEITVVSESDLNEDENKYFQFLKTIIVPIEQHTECMCDCRIKKSHCTKNQEYLKDECRCQCKNVEEKEKCKASGGRKAWNSELCVCQCQEIEQCPTKFYFDPNTCSCKEIAVPSWIIDNRRTGYNFPPTGNTRDTLPVIVPLDASDPRRRHKEDPEF